MRYCIIKVAGACYSALFPSTCAAAADAMRRYPHATRISVRVPQVAAHASCPVPAMRPHFHAPCQHRAS